jgi:hypothetical protein
MRGGRGVRGATIHLRQRWKRRATGAIAKGHGVNVATLLDEAVPIQTATPQTRWRAGFESSKRKPQSLQTTANAFRNTLANSPTGHFERSSVHERTHKRACGQHHCTRKKIDAGFKSVLWLASKGTLWHDLAKRRWVNLTRLNNASARRYAHPHNSTIINKQVIDRGRNNCYIARLQQKLCVRCIRMLVVLTPRTANRRSARHVEHAKHNARGICSKAHNAAERINLSNDLPFGKAANGRVA